MSDGPYGIQQKGRIFDIGEKATSGTEQRSKGKVSKNCSWKHSSTCQNCGSVFAGRSGAANRFCKNECQHEFSVKRWLNCSICHAAIGIGGQSSGKLLGVAATTITRQWMLRGIKANKPKSGSYAMLVSPLITKAKDEKQRPQKEYEAAAMQEIKLHRSKAVFPDWGYEWTKEKAAKASIDYYRSLSDEKRIERNQKCHALRKLRHLENPEIKARDTKKTNEWKKRNPLKNRQSVMKSRKKRMLTDPGFKIQCNLRNRMKELIQAAKDPRRLLNSSLTGCNTRQLAAHLQSQFDKWMTWENYGTRWHVDHIVPVSKFDHTLPHHVKQCWHYTNLRPLCAKENMAKSDKILKNTQLCLTL